MPRPVPAPPPASPAAGQPAASPAAGQPAATVLLVDDEAPIRASLGSYLERSGYRVLRASDGVEALDLLGAYSIDIIVSDVLMPRMDGRELVRRVRAGGTWTPIILLTQVDASYERVSALDDGADDYLSKPFDPAELASRIRAVLRRTRGVGQPLTAASRLMAGELTLDRAARRVTLAGREVSLTPKAVTLLDYLMSHPGELHTREALLSALWGIDFVSSTRAVDHRIREIRRALGDDATHPIFIETVPQGGYRFCAEVHT
ncbi:MULTISPECIES: response regulator transcription factor [unclassified Actinomyces]|uniref:response regulator transcription factor n=1 Tax=unclassified Actinomyces TaxID=2609248 RepID=UPI000D59344E|nr:MULTISPECIES: response regulator transcription factor [unclassified Actinomyces]RAX20849.1 DNA-binding response regulator [Actinomyces sp. Z5]RAX22739.1 DNA-binding response regulator [Actinomyces sp. Z3]